MNGYQGGLRHGSIWTQRTQKEEARGRRVDLAQIWASRRLAGLELRVWVGGGQFIKGGLEASAEA
jgi:hypothetical protein